MVASLQLANRSSIPLPQAAWAVSPVSVLQAAIEVNDLLGRAAVTYSRLLDFYEIIDMRMLSGLIGEMFVDQLARREPDLEKNPNLDGYPDLCDTSAIVDRIPAAAYLHFTDGGLEVKNTFGSKRSGTDIAPRHTRRDHINRRLTWKAHHRSTNYLLALQSDYLDKVPQIVRGFFSDTLAEDDWSHKAQPKKGSAMTSFCQTQASAYTKLTAWTVFGDPQYLNQS